MTDPRFEISIVMVHPDEPMKPSEYSCSFDSKEKAIEGSSAFVKQMVRDGWVPVAIVINNTVYIPTTMGDGLDFPFSVN